MATKLYQRFTKIVVEVFVDPSTMPWEEAGHEHGSIKRGEKFRATFCAPDENDPLEILIRAEEGDEEAEALIRDVFRDRTP